MLSHPELVLSLECILPDFLAHACDRILEIRPNTAVMPVEETHNHGRALVRLYYGASPPMARAIAGDDALRAGVRTLLRPMVGLAHMAVARR